MEGIGIALDPAHDRMFVTDLGGNIYVAALDGSGHRPIRALQGNLTGIAYAELPDGSPDMSRHRVVVIGSGFGGLTATKALKHAPVDVTMIARTQHHLFQPLLYQVATGILSEGDIAPATRTVLATRTTPWCCSATSWTSTWLGAMSSPSCSGSATRPSTTA